MERQRSIDTEGILFLIQTHKLWNLSPEGDFESFYDPLQRRLVFLQLFNIYAFEPYNNERDSNPVYFRLPYKCKRADALTISHDDRYVAIQEGNLEVNFIEFGAPSLVQAVQKKQTNGLPKESRVHISSSKGRILALSFIQSPYFNLILCHGKGLEIYKYVVDKKQLTSVKSMSFNTLDAWVNPISGVVVLSSSSTKGEMQTYSLRKDEVKLKSVKGASFVLALRQPDPPNTNKSDKQQRDTKAQKFYCEVSQLLTKNIKLYNEELKVVAKRRQEGWFIHRLMLAKMYSKDVFIHYNQNDGTVQSYRLNFDKVQKSPHTISMDPLHEYAIQVSDNLLIVTNTTTNFLTIYDHKSIYKFSQPLCITKDPI